LDPRLRTILAPRAAPRSGPTEGLGGPGRLGGPEGAGGSFLQELKDSLSAADRLQQDADRSIAQLVVGGEADLHNTIIALQKAEISFQLVVQVREKVLQAYHEIMRMSV
jgi:flagellar hook-basal body complex protein FliE